MNKNEAVSKMVNEFNCIPHDVAMLLYRENELEEVTTLPTNIVPNCSFFLDEDVCEGYLNNLSSNDDLFCEGCEICIEENTPEDVLPMWGWLWEIKDDLYIEDLSELGFRVYKSDLYENLIVGIDGAGFSFMDHYWLPLYNLIGLKWHDEPYKWEEIHTDKSGNKVKFELE